MRFPPVRRLGRRLTAALVALALACTAALVGAPASASAASNSKLTVAISSDVSTFNPFLAYFQSELDVIQLIYPTLVWPGKKDTPTKYLADSWTTSSDKLTWTFHLHKGLKWSDGQPITAHDVAWTLNLIMHNKDAATANGSLVENFKSVTAPDDNTVVVTTKQAQADMLYVVGLPIVPEHIWKSKVGDLANFKNTSGPIVGYGPFTFENYKTDQYTTLKANKDFFQGAPHFDTMIMQYFKNTDAAVAALRSGQVDQVDALTATEFKALQHDKKLKTYQYVGNRWTGVEINPGARTVNGKKIGTGNPILTDATVRKAMSYGIDRKTLVKRVLDGYGQVGHGYLPPAFQQWFWTPSESALVSYDPTKANSMLDDAGYTRGSNGIRVDPKTGKPMSFRLGIHSDRTTDAQIANYLVGWMKDLGIKLTIQSMSSTALNENLAKGDWDLLMDSWGTGPDPVYLLSIQTCGVLPQEDGSAGNTDSFFCNKQYDSLYAKQQQQFDQSARRQTIVQMQKILYNADVDVMLYYATDLAATRTDTVQDFVYGQPDSQGYYPFQVPLRNWLGAKPAASDPSGSSNTGLIVGIVVAVVVVLLVGGGFALRRRSTSAERE